MDDFTEYVLELGIDGATVIRMRGDVNEKFDVRIRDLYFLGSGEWGFVFGVDKYSVLKFAGSYHERQAITELIDTGLISEPGFASVIPGDTLEIDDYFIYRTELLLPFRHADEWLDEKDKKFILSKIWQLNSLVASIVGIYPSSDVEWVDEKDRQFILAKILEANYLKASKDDPIRSISGVAELFLECAQRLYLLNNPMLSSVVLSWYQAATTGLLLWDIAPDNLGFRFNEDRKTPALDAGLVFFDPMV